MSRKKREPNANETVAGCLEAIRMQGLKPPFHGRFGIRPARFQNT